MAVGNGRGSLGKGDLYLHVYIQLCLLAKRAAIKLS